MPAEIIEEVFLYATNGRMMRPLATLDKFMVERDNRKRLKTASKLLRLSHKLSGCMPYVFKQLRASMKAELAEVRVRKSFGEIPRDLVILDPLYPGFHEVQRALVSRQYTSDIARVDRLKGAWGRIRKRAEAKVRPICLVCNSHEWY